MSYIYDDFSPDGKLQAYYVMAAAYYLYTTFRLAEYEYLYSCGMWDINIWRERQNEFDPEQKFAGDKAYIGEGQIKTPHKKPKKQELTEKQKKENQEFSSLRVFVEHVIRLVKIFRVASDRFRLNIDKYESVISTVCGLVRLRIGALI